MKQNIISYCSTNRETWKLVYWDDQSMVYLKNLDKFKQIIHKYEYRILHPYLVAADKRTLDSLAAVEPNAFREEIRRKIAEEPEGFFTNFCLAAARHYKITY